MAQQLSLIPVQVTFHPGAIGTSRPLFTFILDGVVIPPGEIMYIRVPSGIGMIVFQLDTAEGSEQAYFQTEPIQWFGTDLDGNRVNTPLPLPSSFSFDRVNDTLLKVVDFNSNLSPLPADKNHWFNLIVAYEGNTYGSDPSIVNEPPIQ